MLIPRFLITNEALKNIAKIEASSEVIEGLPLIPVWEIKLREEALVRQIYFTLKDAGNKLSLNEVERIVKEEPLRNESPQLIMDRAGVAGSEKDVQAVINCRNALKIVDQWIVMEQKKIGEVIYSKEQLLQIQVLMMDRLIDPLEIGKWRTIQLGVRNFEGETFKPANAVEVPYQIDDLFNWLNSREVRELHPALKACVVDFELSRIQPFGFGSDWITKTYVLFCLAVEGINRKRLVSFEEEREKNKEVLYKLIAEAGRTGMMTGYVQGWSKIVFDAMVKLQEKVRRLAVDTQVRSKIGTQTSLSERQIKLIEYLTASTTVTLSQVRRNFSEVSDDTILRDLKDLIKKGLVKKKGKTKGAKYMLKDSIK